MSKLVRTALFGLLLCGAALPLAVQSSETETRTAPTPNDLLSGVPAADVAPARPAVLPAVQPPLAGQPKAVIPTAAAPAPACGPGFKLVEEIVYKEVVRKVCKVVPEVKKHRQIVYCTKREDYCLKQCPCVLGCGQGCKQCCPLCEKPRCRDVLLKKEVLIEECDWKCVVECVKAVVPHKVYRKVPCPTLGPAAYPPSTMPPARN